jgi:hypothetical protein
MLSPPSAFQLALDRIAAIGGAVPLRDTSGNEFRAAPLAYSRPPTFLKEQIKCSLETAHPAIPENALIPVSKKLRWDQMNVQDSRNIPRHPWLGFDAQQLQQRCRVAKPHFV